MTQFEKLQERVSAAVAALPYALTEEQNARLQKELQTIKDYRRAEMLNAAAEVAKECIAKNQHPELSCNEGYCVSFVCWLIGISDFNPFDHPWLITEDYALNTFRDKSSINFYLYESTDARRVMKRLYGAKIKYEAGNWKIDKEDSEDGQDFSMSLYMTPQHGLHYRAEQAIRANVDPTFNSLDIPLDDKETFDLMLSNDWLGVEQCGLSRVMFLEAIRRIQPRTFSELVHTRAMKDQDLLDLDAYVYNRDNGISEYTGIKAVDDILRPTNGILLYTRQQDELKKVASDLSEDELRLIRYDLDDSTVRPKCSIYTIVIDMYRRAYMKAHYPDIFRQVLIVTEAY